MSWKNSDFSGLELTYSELVSMDIDGSDLTGATYYRPPNAPPARELRRMVAEIIERNHPDCEGVDGLACHLGGGNDGMPIGTAATVLLWVDGLPMPPFEHYAPREEILAALRCGEEPSDHHDTTQQTRQV